MISIHVSAVCRVRDGYTGRELPSSSLVCALDGLPCRPVGKPGGYLVLTNLADGPHRLSLRGQGYQEEWVEFQADGGTRELDVTMKPGEGYLFRQTVTRLTLTVLEKKVPAAGRVMWLASDGLEMKLAQAKAEAGEREMRIYRKGPPLLGAYLIEDGKNSEIVTLSALEGERGILAAPLKNSHSRSKRFLPAQRYHTGEDGRLTAVFPSPGAVQMYVQDRGLIGQVELSEGINELSVTI